VSAAVAVAPVAASAPEAPAIAGADKEAASVPAPPQPAAKTEKKEKHVAKKAPRKPKSERRGRSKPRLDEHDEDTVATAYSDERDDEAIVARPSHSRHIVRRWAERDYDLDEDGRGQRRVIVIHHDRGGLFGNMFGGFDD
jgi:hypothetical protein